jgi:hypothetical protein
MNKRRWVVCAGIVLASAGTVLAHSGTHPDTVVARVGGGTITQSSLVHWMHVTAPEHEVPDSPRYLTCTARVRALVPRATAYDARKECARQYQAVEQRALDHLITMAWLTADATDRGVGASREAVARRLEQEKRSFPEGTSEFAQSLTAIGRTASDEEREVEAQIAFTNLRNLLERHEHRPSPREIVSYYRRNISRFKTPERRYFYIVENLKSEAGARKLIRDIRRGTSLAEMSLHEWLPRTDFARVRPLKRIIYEAIFAAKPHTLAEPVTINKLHFVFEVTRVKAARLTTLQQARARIAAKLTRERRQHALIVFFESWRQRWTARTDCAPGYVVDQCKQYRGPRRPDQSLATLEEEWAPH